MKLPIKYTDDFYGVEGGYYTDDVPTPKVYSLIFPPIGFFPFAGTGNGDYHGFYWPIGREDSEPMIAYSSHDAFSLIPEYGSMTTAAQCQIAQSEDRKPLDSFAAAMDIAGVDIPTNKIYESIPSDGHKLFLDLDCNSPFRNCAVADMYVSENDLDSAEKLYRKAIEWLPEYAAAHFGLGYLLRRTRRPSEAAKHLRMSLICPLVFWGGSFWAEHILPGSFRNDWTRKALHWLRGIRDPDESLKEDPFILRIQELTFETGVAENNDMEVLDSLVTEYISLGQHSDAIFLWVNRAERAAMETTSFRERYGITPRSYGSRLVDLLTNAGYQQRADLLKDMLLKMENPDALHL